MTKISSEKLLSYRARTYRITREHQLRDLQEAASFVKERGFIFFWPIKGIEMPSLWAAVAGDRPVADAHDDPGHISWSWKDQSLGMRIWYYGKVLRKKSTIIDLNLMPYFYALSKNYGNPSEDIQIQYYEGAISRDEKVIFDTINDNGPMDTIAIRKAARMISKETNSRFDRAITNLQSSLKILPVGISDAGGWRYAFIYDLVHRYYPEILETARMISERKARVKLVETYLQSVGAAHLSDVTRLFHWEKTDVTKTIEALKAKGRIICDLDFQNTKGEWFAINEIMQS